MQPLLAIFGGLAIALLLARLRVAMGLAFLGGSVAIPLLAGLSPSGAAAAFGHQLTAGGTWSFVVLVGLVFVLSAVLRIAGSLDVLVQASGHLIRNRRLRLASMPALVGLLPMPGGAIVSAPLVSASGSDAALDAGDRNLVNYWFRHVWEICWPLYPALLLAASFLGGSVALVCAFQVPLFVVLVVLGWLFVLRPIPLGGAHEAGQAPDRRKLVQALLPFAAVVAGMPLFGFLVRDLVPDGRAGEIGLMLALAVAILLAAVLHGSFRVVVQAAGERTTWTLLLLAFSVRLFGGMVSETGAAAGTAEFFRAEGVPTLVTVIVLPLLVGFAAGNTIATVSVTFPVVIALLGGIEMGWRALLPPVLLAYAAGFVGYMLSPVHMCLVLSSRYFGVGLARAWVRLPIPLALFGAAAFALFGLLTQALVV